MRRRGRLGRRRQGARPAAVAPLGRVPAAHPDDRDRRLPRQRADIAERGRRAAGARSRRSQAQGRLASRPRTTRLAFREAREAAGADFVLAADANQAWTPRRGVRFARLVEDSVLVWLEEPCRWDNDRRALRDVRHAAGVPRLRGPERVLRGGLPRSHAGGRDRRLQLRLLLVRRADRVASCRRGRARARHRDGASRGAADREPPARVDPARHLRRVLPPGSRPDLVEPRREPPAARRRARSSSRTRPGLGWELDLDYLEAHAVA